jgi:hypothetical protein
MIMMMMTTALWVSSPVVVHGWTSISTSAVTNRRATTTATKLFESKAPKHDVGANPLDQLKPDQKERVQAFMEYQQSLPRIGFPTDVRSLVQYNHGFAVMSTNSKS